MSHRLDRLELEIHTTSEPLARQLHDRLSRLHQRVLAELLGRVLDQFSPPGTLHRLESLELDLGEIPEEQLERLLPERLERALREALPAKLPKALVGDGLEPPGEMAAPRALELLAAHAATGQLPWWAPRQNPRLIPAALETALALPAAELAAWWRQEVAQAAARQRLLAAADPDQAARLRELLGDGLGVEREEAPLAAAPSADRKDIAESGAVTDGAWRPPEGRQGGQGHEAQDVLPEAPLGHEAFEIASPAAKPPPLPSAALSQASALELLATYASTAQLHRWAPRQNPRLIPAVLEIALALPAAELVAWWRQEVAQTAARQRLLTAADPDQAARLRELLGEALGDGLGDGPGDGLEMEEGETPLAAASSADSEDIAESGGGIATPGRPLAGSRQADGEAQQGSLSDALMAQQGREDFATASPDGANPPSAVLHPARASASDTASALELLAAYASTGQLPTPHLAKPDEPLGLDGAGLVMLSPFLETLFERLAWLTPERRFLGPEEQRRAVALLGFLVDGEASPPEWRLSLAKLLCGLELEALCGLEAPLSEAEQAEGEALLQATLVHGQGLLGDEIGPLREGILQRPALLSWRPGAWLLVVERREGDEALEELPWSWGWIRLPWMDAVLQVVW